MYVQIKLTAAETPWDETQEIKLQANWAEMLLEEWKFWQEAISPEEMALSNPSLPVLH